MSPTPCLLYVLFLSGAIAVRLRSLCPDDRVWSVCLQKLREYVYPTWMSERRDAPPAAIIVELTAFLEGSSVGPVNGNKALPAAERIAQLDGSPLVKNFKDLCWNAGRRIQGCITTDTAHEDIALSNIGAVWRKDVYQISSFDVLRQNRYCDYDLSMVYTQVIGGVIVLTC
ncbi:hypothetical protein IW261DRAFT_1442152 [Armillaria novae-zelandiae]|uniref:Uncharacterized protein n=1 Tax=Armillaria novae-zelandiae TaxID=153914 RepID=A0AA39UIF8_9AGAR|nr:hypothetical protein IW261DRAFT_1442152 [Armillaria novae-zelandiae]